MIRDEEYREEREITEKITLLRDAGYRGYSVTGINQSWNGVSVTANRVEGRELEAFGETLDQAYESLAELIDYTLDDIT
ncbi:MAG: hypothetical protein JJU46_10045 [Balneolaceae bacterium]|nr:hypothetical protein [Balneolaceae bacterium]MCH8550264.1 hypothetical protein [Balneolaceae bacterium]